MATEFPSSDQIQALQDWAKLHSRKHKAYCDAMLKLERAAKYLQQSYAPHAIAA